MIKINYEQSLWCSLNTKNRARKSISKIQTFAIPISTVKHSIRLHPRDFLGPLAVISPLASTESISPSPAQWSPWFTHNCPVSTCISIGCSLPIALMTRSRESCMLACVFQCRIESWTELSSHDSIRHNREQNFLLLFLWLPWQKLWRCHWLTAFLLTLLYVYVS